MNVALFVAAGSLFLGQQKLFPHALRGSPILFAPELAIVVMTIVWLVRLRRRTLESAHSRASGDPGVSNPTKNLMLEQRLLALGYLDNAGSPLSRG
jgi:hypothetical protein